MKRAAQDHWNERYRTAGASAVSWFEDRPEVSLELLDLLGATSNDSVIDIGGGASMLVDHLLRQGHQDLTVLDVSSAALDVARERVGDTAFVSWLAADLQSWAPGRRWNVWHDRAVLHFLTDEGDRSRYAETLRAAVEPGGAVVIGVFAEDGPTECSALPVRRYSLADLRGLLPGLVVVSERREEHRTPAGIVQPFNWIAGRVPS